MAARGYFDIPGEMLQRRGAGGIGMDRVWTSIHEHWKRNPAGSVVQLKKESETGGRSFSHWSMCP